MLKNKILEKIDSLLVFNELLPEANRAEYINHLNKVKNDVYENLTALIDNNKNNLENSESYNQAFSSKSLNKKSNSFTYITKILIPKLSEKGKNTLEEISTSISLYKSIKMINEKSSILDIYYMQAHRFNNYLEFLSLIKELAEKEYISFIKTENLLKKEGWVKTGKILEECNIVDQENINRAIAYQKNGNVKYIGEALTELKYTNKTLLDNALKLQKWIGEIIENSIFIVGINDQEKITTSNAEIINDNASNIMDFIIPVLTEPTRKMLAKLNNEYSDTLKIIDEKSSLLKIYEKNKDKFEDKLDFLKLILKLDLQEFLAYKKNDTLEKRDAWIKFGALSMNLGVVSENQIDETFIYRHRNVNRQIFIGEALVELKFMTKEKKIEILNLQRWCNMVLAKISYETSFINAVKEILEANFNCLTEIGKFSRISLNKPLSEDMICVVFKILGKLNGQIYYIFDKQFFEDLTKNVLASHDIDFTNLDKSIVAEICNIITDNSLTKLSNLGIFCQANIPEIHIGDNVCFAEKNVISALPLMNQFGRFIIGFGLKG